MLPRLALPGRRIATLGATRDFHHGLLRGRSRARRATFAHERRPGLQHHKGGKDDDGHVNYLKGSNIAGFVKVADAMLAYGHV